MYLEVVIALDEVASVVFALIVELASAEVALVVFVVVARFTMQ